MNKSIQSDVSNLPQTSVSNLPQTPKPPVPETDFARPHSSDDPVDVTSEDSFPASDAPSWTAVSGTGNSHPAAK